MAMATSEHHPEMGGPTESFEWSAAGDEFVLLDTIHPPARIEMARERMLLSRLYLALIRSLNDDYGADFARDSDSATLRAIGIYLFLRTAMCSPARVSTVAQALKLPRTTVLRRIEDMIKQGYVERIGNAYRVTDKVNVPDLQQKLQHRIDMILETAQELSKLRKPAEH
jgi:DNA-binding MarR family transcriptional regulator